MAHKDFTENQTAQVGAGMTTLGIFGKTAAISKGIGVTAGLKSGALIGSILNPPVAIIGGLALIGGAFVHHILFNDDKH